mgnify:CR=1 FL=1
MDQNEKLNKLRQQIHLIEHNLIALDDLELVALNIATNVRVLVHDTISSTSLLKLMSVKDSIDYYDTSVAKGSISFWKGNFSISGWDLSSLPHIGIVGKEINVLSDTECLIKYTPVYKDWNVKGKKVDFQTWWNTEIFDNNKGVTLTRKELILNATNKDGGAHIDEPSIAYKAFGKSDVLPFSLNSIPKTAENIPIYACIAQIGWELSESIKDNNLL